MFVLDLYSSAPVDDDEEEGVRVDEDAGMYVDEGDGEGNRGYGSDEGRNGDGPLDNTLEANLVLLAAWADMFLDVHLRMLEPFAEIWFVDPRFPGRTAAGFTQRVMEGEREGRAEHMIYYPMLKRDGWWWDEGDLGLSYFTVPDNSEAGAEVSHRPRPHFRQPNSFPPTSPISPSVNLPPLPRAADIAHSPSISPHLHLCF